MSNRDRQPGIIAGLLILVLLVSGACRTVTGAPRAAATETRAPRPTRPAASVPSPNSGASPEAPLVTPEKKHPTSQAVLDACQADQQEQALGLDNVALADLGMKTCYDLTLTLNEDGSEYRGSARITFTNLTGQELTEVIFRIYPNSPEIYGGRLEVTEARVGDTAVETEVFLADDTALRMPLPSPLEDTQTITIELQFVGEVPSNFEQGGYGIFQRTTQSEEGPIVSLANAYPILAEWEDGQWQAAPVIPGGDAVVSETSLYRVNVEVPQGWQVAATGISAGEESGGDNPSSTFFSGPARDFILLTSPAFELNERQYEDIRIRHWGVQEIDREVDEVLQVAVDSIQIYEEKFGPYPYPELDIVALPLRYAAGVEYPTLILIEQSLYSPSDSFLRMVVAHEVGHQWWYATVGNDILEEPWQDEGLTTFSALLYDEQVSRNRYQSTIQMYESQVKSYEETHGEEPVAQPVSAFEENIDGYSVIVYFKGALFFVDLREELGDDVFFEALQRYYQAQQFSLAPRSALLDAFEESCNCELDDLYEQWGVNP